MPFAALQTGDPVAHGVLVEMRRRGVRLERVLVLVHLVQEKHPRVGGIAVALVDEVARLRPGGRDHRPRATADRLASARIRAWVPSRPPPCARNARYSSWASARPGSARFIRRASASVISMSLMKCSTMNPGA